jgi:uncharacterized protein HemY
MDGLTSMMSGITIISIVIPIIITVVVLFFVFRFLGNLSKAGQATQQLLMTGVPATATVLQLEDGGMRVNDNPMVNVMLQVNSTQFGTYQAVVQSIVPMIKLAQVQPGQSVNVKVDPSNPQRVALELR